MDWPALLAKIVGVVLLGTTIRSIYKHVRDRMRVRAANRQDQQSVGESVLNNILLYAWLAFMLAFSTGMIVNN